MRFQLLALAAIAASTFPFFVPEAEAAETDVRISGPHIHENLTVYFIHGKSDAGPVPLTLSEAIDKGRVRVIETESVNELKIENTGDDAVFIQSGDIVKGGKQDRVITSSLVIQPKSGEVPLAAFCVEQGRWSARGTESVARFASSYESVPSREAKLAMKAPREVAATAGIRPDRERGGYSRQSDVWSSVAKTQQKLSGSLNADVAASASASSLQLSLENEKLKAVRQAYIDALQAAGENGADIVGYAFAVNGRLNSADVYSSNGLFQKMWNKQLQAAATEAIGEKGEKSDAAPTAELVKAFLADAKRGEVKEDALKSDVRLEVRDSARAFYFASSPASGAAFHESFVAK